MNCSRTPIQSHAHSCLPLGHTHTHVPPHVHAQLLSASCLSNFWERCWATIVDIHIPRNRRQLVRVMRIGPLLPCAVRPRRWGFYFLTGAVRHVARRTVQNLTVIMMGGMAMAVVPCTLLFMIKDVGTHETTQVHRHTIA